MEILDLDLLRPDAKIIKLGGKKIDVSFIPCGITFDIDRITREISTLNLKEVEAGGDETRRAFDLSIELCSIYCQTENPEMTPAWFEKHLNAQQISAMVTAIRETLYTGYKQVEGYSKNGEAVKTS
jgi:hypothetical protein